MQKINYIYGRSNQDTTILLGVEKQIQENGQNKKYGFYYGIYLSLFDAIKNKEIIGIENIATFLKKYEEYKASGIVFFPQIQSYGLLEENDAVVSSLGELEQIASELEASISENHEAQTYDADNALAELCDNPVLLRTSNR